MSPDGQWAYLGERNGCSTHGYQKINTATNTVAETVYLPFTAMSMLPLPDNQRLLASSYNWIGVVNIR